MNGSYWKHYETGQKNTNQVELVVHCGNQGSIFRLVAAG